MGRTQDSPRTGHAGRQQEGTAESTAKEVIPMIEIAKIELAEVSEKQTDCCTAMRGRKNLDVQTNVMLSDPDGCE